MGNPTGTGAESEDDDAQKQEIVPPVDESQGDGGKPPDGYVKKSQFLAALNSASAKADQETARANALARENEELRSAQAKASAPKGPTRAELNAMVSRGDITQEQADAVWEKKLLATAKREAAETTAVTIQTERHQAAVEAELAAYREMVPDAWVAGSDARTKVEAAYNRLVRRGFPAAKETEAAALDAAFGDLDTLRASKSVKTGSKETHSETGGGKPPGDAGGKDVLKGLTTRQREYYDAKIRQGIYPNWEAVRAELKHARPGARG